MPIYKGRPQAINNITLDILIPFHLKWSARIKCKKPSKAKKPDIFLGGKKNFGNLNFTKNMIGIPRGLLFK